MMANLRSQAPSVRRTAGAVAKTAEAVDESAIAFARLCNAASASAASWEARISTCS